jgi:hypothetical protein
MGDPSNAFCNNPAEGNPYQMNFEDTPPLDILFGEGKNLFCMLLFRCADSWK